jgi:predicted nucleic acid-binding protein
MPGSVIDLSVPGQTFPDPVVVDANLIVEYLLAPFVAVLPPSSITRNAERAAAFFQALIVRNGTGIVTPTAFAEVIHVAVKATYQQALRRLGPAARQTYCRPIKDWLSLYKQDATILQAFRPDLEQLRRLLIANGLLFLGPDQLGPILSGRTFDEELVHLVAVYGLDSSDALIVMEAQRCGVTDIVTLDAELQRTRADFDIYTWR